MFSWFSKIAASDPENEQLKVPISEPTTSVTREDRPTSKTPEALNMVVEELVEYELHKIKSLSQIEHDNVADGLITSDATLNEIYEAVRKERESGMPGVDC